MSELNQKIDALSKNHPSVSLEEVKNVLLMCKGNLGQANLKIMMSEKTRIEEEKKKKFDKNDKLKTTFGGFVKSCEGRDKTNVQKPQSSSSPSTTEYFSAEEIEESSSSSSSSHQKNRGQKRPRDEPTVWPEPGCIYDNNNSVKKSINQDTTIKTTSPKSKSTLSSSSDQNRNSSQVKKSVIDLNDSLDDLSEEDNFDDDNEVVILPPPAKKLRTRLLITSKNN
eukprot:TRINITY_DN2652_c0_g1_i1.p1 TRINITY_DN2652_c0_g1~~TRINITY_DN2652_c0_g1_i1.p1  ORF type:complete len:224 (-),score=65.31 TRINITY_DN2652_c0_g1_i1:109-780(-)